MDEQKHLAEKEERELKEKISAILNQYFARVGEREPLTGLPARCDPESIVIARKQGGRYKQYAFYVRWVLRRELHRPEEVHRLYLLGIINIEAPDVVDVMVRWRGPFEFAFPRNVQTGMLDAVLGNIKLRGELEDWVAEFEAILEKHRKRFREIEHE